MEPQPNFVYFSDILRDAIKEYPDFANVEVYSDVDSGRSFEGTPIVEIGLQNTETRNYIDGTFQRTYNYTAFVRCKTYEDTQILTWRIGSYVIKHRLDQERRRGTLESFAIYNIGVESDVIDRTRGASFTGYIQIRIIEPVAAF